MIRSIHPLYLLAFLCMLLITLMWKNSQVEDQIAYLQKERAQSREMAKRIVSLKKVMKAPQKRQLNNFLDSSVFGGSDLTHRIKNGRYVISAKRLDARQLQSLLNRVLNMSVKVSQLKIEASDDRHASFYMEINL